MNARPISFTKMVLGLLKWSPDLTALFGSKQRGMLMSKTREVKILMRLPDGRNVATPSCAKTQPF